MKTILTAVILFIGCSAFAQEDENIKSGTPINSGFVFIDGKYIEPPYEVKRKGLAIYINGIQVTKELEDEKKPIECNTRLGIPPCINKLSTSKEWNSCKLQNSDVPYLLAMGNYYITHYEFDLALDSIINFYRNLPNVASLVNYDKEIWEITLYNGDKFKMLFGGPVLRKKSKKWGPNGTGPASKDELKKRINQESEIIEKNLLSNYIIVLDTTNANNKLLLLSDNKHLKYFYSIIQNNNLIIEQKADSLKSMLIGNPNFIKKFIEKHQTSPTFDKRIKLILDSKEINDNSNDKELNDLPSNKEINNKSFSKETNNKTTSNKKNDLKKGGAKTIGTYSPSRKEIFAYCSGSWDDAFSSFQTEVDDITGYIEYEDYTYNQANIFDDNTPNDDDFGTCTYANLKLMKDAGFLYLATHGVLSGVLFVYATSPSAITGWSQGSPLIIPVQIPPLEYPVEWDINLDLWAAASNANWAQTYWEPDHTANNTISILSSCYSVPNGWVNACGGGITFGYEDETEYYGVIENNEELLKRMNGKFDSGTHREASDAYNYMPVHNYGFSYVANNKITLCPSPTSYTTFVPAANTGVANFDLDTYCDASQDPSLALVPELVTGGGEFTNIHWDNVTSEGLSNSIKFTWFVDDHCKYKMHVNPDYIRTKSPTGEYHRLDFNGVTPIESTPYYYFQTPYFTPNVSFTNQQTNGTLSVQFNGSSNLGTSANYTWNFGDGTSEVSGSGYLFYNYTHTYTSAGVYSVKLTVSSGTITKSIINQVFVIDPTQNTPVLDVYCNTSISTPNINESVNITANISTGYIFGHNYHYFFEISDDNNFYYVDDRFSTAAMEDINYSFSILGTYRIRIIVYDNTDETFWGFCEQLLTINDPFPCGSLTADFDFSPLNPFEDEYVYFTEQTSGGSPPYYWCWYFLPEVNSGDPQPGDAIKCIDGAFHTSGNPGIKFGYTYGTYPIHLIVTDNTGCAVEVVKYLSVRFFYGNYVSYDIVSYIEPEYNPIRIRLSEDGHPCPVHISPYIDGYYGINVSNYFWPNTWTDIYWKVFNSVKEHIWSNNIADGEEIYCNYTHPDYTAYNVQISVFNAVSFDYGFNQQGSYFVQMEANLHDNIQNHDFTINAGKYVEVIDCNLLSEFVSSTNPFTNAVINLPYVSAGSFLLTSTINNYINSHEVELIACNEIILDGDFQTGNYDFVAGGGLIEPCWYGQTTKKDTIILNSANTNKNIVNAYPNPFDKYITIDYKVSDKENIIIKIENSLGEVITEKLIKELPDNENQIIINTQKLTPGIYFILFQNADFSKIFKVVKTSVL